ncbi:MAG: ribbon-helix-helix protein, CopG family [Actinomycetota bacterium]|nr:ribbon-helix-helix protein, CopG family [Actinomycetota bacterium]MDI6821511.1 ribbon-helix-helix protein, CopG family [Actinomycetota bacterium]
MSLTKKAMILFEPEQYRKLEEKAKLRGVSVAALIREAVEKTVLAEDEVSKKVRMQAAQRIISAQEKLPTWEEIEELIARGHGGW